MEICVLSISGGLTSEARFANTVIAVDAIFADAIVTWVTGTIIEIYLTVCACVDKEEFSHYILNILTTAENMLQYRENVREIMILIAFPN